MEPAWARFNTTYFLPSGVGNAWSILLGQTSTSPPWSRAVIVLLQVFVVGLIFRTWLGPFILRKVYRRMRIKSISPRSIRGLYLHTGSSVWMIDRIGLSYHHPSTDSARRFSVKVEGIYVTVLDNRPHEGISQRHSRRVSTVVRSSKAVSDFLWSLYSGVYHVVDPYLRPLIRGFFVTFIRGVIRCLPALTQVLDFEVDQVVVTFENIPGAHVTMGSATIFAKLVFTNIGGSHVAQGTGIYLGQAQYRFLGMSHLKDRLYGSVRRVWNRAWGQTQGEASVTITLRKVALRNDLSIDESTEFNYSSVSVDEGINLRPVASSRYDLISRLRSGICAELPDANELMTSLKFGPTRDIIMGRSVRSAVNIPAVHVKMATLNSLLHRLETQRYKENEDDTSGNLESLTSVTSGLNTKYLFSQERATATQRETKRFKPNQVLNLFQSLKLNIHFTSVDLNPMSDGGQPVSTYVLTFFNVYAGCWVSEPSDYLCRNYMGKNYTIRDSDTESAYTLSFKTKKVEGHRLPTSRSLQVSQVLAVGAIELECFIHQWPINFSVLPEDFLCPFEPKVVARIVVESMQLCCELQDLVKVFPEKRTQTRATRRSAPTPIKNIPKVVFEGNIRNINFCVASRADCSEPATNIMYRSDGFTILTNGNYARGKKTIPFLDNDTSKGVPSSYEAVTQVVFEPGFVTCLSQHSPDNSIPGVSCGSYGEPLFSYSVVDLVLESIVPVTFLENEDVLFEIPGTEMNLSCGVDILSLELWNPIVVTSLGSALATLRVHGEASSTLPPIPHIEEDQDSLPAKPYSITVSVGCGQIIAIVTAKDINPNEDQGLTRGLGAKTALRVEVCVVGDAMIRSRSKWYARTRSMHELGIQDDLVPNAIALAQNDKSPKLILARVALVDVAIRTAMATCYSADAEYNTTDDLAYLKAHEFIWARMVEFEVKVCSPLLGEGKTQVLVNARIPNVRANIQVFHVYCMLLAASITKAFEGGSKTPAAVPNDQISLSINGTLGICDVGIKLPLDTRLHCRLSNLTVGARESSNGVIDWRSLQLFVPSSGPEDIWEEAFALGPCRTTSTLDHSTRTFSISADVMRLFIPFGYIVADLILDLSIMLKAVRHLTKIVAGGVFQPMDDPSPESAKNIPSVLVSISRVLIEIADDPWESKLALISKAGLEAASTRMERDDAFQAKIAAIEAAEQGNGPSSSSNLEESRFNARHTVSVQDALNRLHQVHSISWVSTLDEHKHEQRVREDKIRAQYRTDRSYTYYEPDDSERVRIKAPDHFPPLLRITITSLSLRVSPPLLTSEELVEYLHDVGKGLPRDTEFDLLVPMNLNIGMGTSSVTLRDYPVPLLHIPHARPSTEHACTINTTMVIAEELGTNESVVWKPCEIVPDGVDNATSKGYALLVPKTTMPVKTYATPVVKIQALGITQICWGVGYSPMIQDVMRVIDTLTSPPPDPSPGIGFWDKARLVLHWRVKVQFLGRVQLSLKGSRNPYLLDGEGAGFAFCWDGGTEMVIGHKNPDMELLQVFSNTMLIVIPEFRSYRSIEYLLRTQDRVPSTTEVNFQYRKICAKFTSGIKWGIGVKLERNCGNTCQECNSTQQCRLFNFKPHYAVQLTPKVGVPTESSPDDSYNEFRSHYIHLSTSLSTSSHTKSVANSGSSSFHLSPKTFAHFWLWWDLFDRAFSLPIRQGSLFPTTRPLTKKFGRHLATLKYRFSVSRLFITHAYIDDSKESWTDGTVNWVGIKAFSDHFEADLHQREQIGFVAVPGTAVPQTKKIKHKPFYAAEVKLVGLKLQGMVSVFSEPLKAQVSMEEGEGDSIYKRLREIPSHNPSADWLDLDDFVEVDWRPSDESPFTFFLDLASCPRFAYLKQQSGSTTKSEDSRFGDEETHVCSLGKEQSVQHVQIDLVAKRLSSLMSELQSLERNGTNGRSNKEYNKADKVQTVKRKIEILERYIIQQRRHLAAKIGEQDRSSEYSPHMVLKDVCSPEDWADFSNVYHFHCPTVTIGKTTRDVLTQYYYCSRARKGFEYHMATRAVKFIRDQAFATKPPECVDKEKKNWTPAQALRKIIAAGDEVDRRQSSSRTNGELNDTSPFDPLSGWSDGVALQRSHFFLLLKPQIVLRGSDPVNGVCVLAAIQAQLQSYAILDTANFDDPVTGRIMTRNYASLSGLQTFRPTGLCNEREGVPFEVLVDLRAESEDFDCLVPQTDATLRYDKFNRLRLNNVASVSMDSSDAINGHLQHQIDLVDIHVPRFKVTADYKGFQAIANVITTLVLVSESAHKIHLDQVETLCFSYDFTDLLSTAGVVESIQSRLRRSVELERSFENGSLTSIGVGGIELMKIKAQTLRLANELSLIFDAIKLAQEKEDGKHSDLKSALKLHTRSQEISWVMTDIQKELIAKLAVRGIDFSWLSRQDSSTVNELEIEDFQAFDGSPGAEWPEILCKYKEPSSHSLVRRGLFAVADWTILAPVGGISIYERFALELHPMRLQLEAKLGRRIMEYVWPDRRNRDHPELTLGEHQQDDENLDGSQEVFITVSEHGHGSRSSLDSPRSLQKLHVPIDTPTLRHLGASRSFTDLRHASTFDRKLIDLPKSVSTESLISTSALARTKTNEVGMSLPSGSATNVAQKHKHKDDASEMKSRSSQKTFVLVRVASVHLLLSVRKDGSFFCRDARIRTRELEYRNQTWSFEELAEQFIPSDPSWRGWVKMALHQPLIPIWPVTKELISKTKWIASKGVSRQGKRLVKAAEKDHDELAIQSTDSGPGPSSSTTKHRRQERVLIKPRPRKSSTGH